jgi:3',5'-cyclic AMP phosphodiesterase CpdA
MAGTPARLLAVSDLHVAYPQNREIVRNLRPPSAADWLLLAGDTGEFMADIEWALGTLSERFGRVIWVPGNHDLWTHPRDPVRLRGEQRYQRLVEVCRNLGVLTPEDPFCVWPGPGGPAVIAPLFLLYDYSFRPAGARTKADGLAQAYATGVVCTDEELLHPELPTVLVSHWPLVREPTRVLRYPPFAQWCGTTRTADWHLRYRARAVVYGHLHIPRATEYDGVPFLEVSLGYPREWQRRDKVTIPRQVLPR